MASDLPGILNDNFREKIKHSKVLVVGAGGIGCELLKNLVLTGFKNIEIIDLDTIDVSNLNRQFLFRKQHVGKSKVKVAKESALRFNKNVHITAHHDNITNSHYGVAYYKKFSLVMNALDNRAARNHVNRMCLAADVPLIESGSAGYLGQVCVIKKGMTECYECQPKAAEKTFPGCTIRNTPSEFIHCVVWAKHLFNQLFGEADPDEDVSPDTSDPNAAGECADIALNSDANEKGNIDRISTRTWAISCGYEPKKLFHKLFHEDIRYLLSMDKLWLKRRPPTPLDWKNLPDAVPCSSKCENEVQEQYQWSMKDCASIFFKSVQCLKEKLELIKEGENLIWDKDDDTAMDFVAACANIRSHIFAIPQKSRFEVKSMAGNIIPAIATSNAIIAGLIVMEALKVLEGRISDCKAIFLSKQPHPKTKHLLALCALVQPNPNCSVCSEKPEISVRLNTKQITVKMLEERILKSQLHMIAPDVEIEDGKGTILISSEEGETSENNQKYLEEFNIIDGSRLKCDDFLQNYQLILNIVQCETLEDNKEFEIVGSINVEPKDTDKMNVTNNGDHKDEMSIDDDDDVCIVEEYDDLPSKKRIREEDNIKKDVFAKKLKLDQMNAS